MTNGDEKIIFNHVPKAGGTSLIDFFRKVFGADRVFRHKNRDSKTDLYSPGIETLTEEELEHYQFFAGHFSYGNHTRFKTPVRYIGVVRDPWERAVSQYVRARGPRAAREDANSRTLEEYIEYRLGLKNKSAGKIFPDRNPDGTVRPESSERDYFRPLSCSLRRRPVGRYADRACPVLRSSRLGAGV